MKSTPWYFQGEDSPKKKKKRGGGGRRLLPDGPDFVGDVLKAQLVELGGNHVLTFLWIRKHKVTADLARGSPDRPAGIPESSREGLHHRVNMGPNDGRGDSRGEFSHAVDGGLPHTKVVRINLGNVVLDNFVDVFCDEGSSLLSDHQIPGFKGKNLDTLCGIVPIQQLEKEMN